MMMYVGLDMHVLLHRRGLGGDHAPLLHGDRGWGHGEHHGGRRQVDSMVVMYGHTRGGRGRAVGSVGGRGHAWKSVHMRWWNLVMEWHF